MTSTEQVIEPLPTRCVRAWEKIDALMRHSRDDAVRVIWQIEDICAEALSRNTPIDSEVERVARAIAEVHRPHLPSVSSAMPFYSELHNNMARAAIASLPPKPVDGEVAALVERLLNLHERMLDAVRKQRPYPVKLHCGDSDTDAVMRAVLALSRNTEPMVTDAMLVAGARAAADRHIECGSYGNIEAIYLAMLSAGEKGADDVEA